MKKTLFTLLALLFAVTTANAYFIEFDATGSGNDANLKKMDEWQLESFGETNADTGAVGDVFVYQSIATGDFTESFTMQVTEGRNSSLPGTNPDSEIAFPPFYADVTLGGKFVSNSEINFTSGNVKVYDNVGAIDGKFDLGTDTLIAELSWSSALVSQLTGSLLGTGGPGDPALGMKIDLTFIFDSVNADYFGPQEEYLVGKQWMFSLIGGRIDQESLVVNPNDNTEYIIEFDLPGMQAEFRAVPEPSTLLLLGAGLVGLVGYSRRRANK